MNNLIRLVSRLRRECPWDRKQTIASVQNNVLEEAYELADAMRRRDYPKIIEEAGDHIFVGLFVAQILEDEGRTTVREVIKGITAKLKRRHPHVFGSVRVRNAHEVVRNWNRIKSSERNQSILSRLPKALPALLRAARIQQRARQVGFDWREPGDVLDKVIEEVEELRAELKSSGPSSGNRDTDRQDANRMNRRLRPRVREELGDLLFALVNAARHLGIDAEDALQRANNKFVRRFQHLEQEFARRGQRLEDLSLEELDAVWEEQKSRRRRVRR